jgi:hypothetical protein
VETVTRLSLSAACVVFSCALSVRGRPVP